MRRDHITLTTRLPIDRGDAETESDRQTSDTGGHEEADTAVRTPDRPVIILRFDGPREKLEPRLRDRSGDYRDGESIDVAFRRQERVSSSEAESLKNEDRRDGRDRRTPQTEMDAGEPPVGVLSLTDRQTGAYVLEANAAAARVLDVVEAARDTSEPPSFEVHVELPDGTALAFEHRTLLVYDSDGSLERDASLIPNGVEL